MGIIESEPKEDNLAFEEAVYKHIEEYVDSRDKGLLRQIGAFFRQWREKSGMSEKHVGESVGVSTHFIILVEEGMIPEGAMPPAFVYKYAQAIGDMELLHEFARRFRAPRYVRAKLHQALEAPMRQ